MCPHPYIGCPKSRDASLRPYGAQNISAKTLQLLGSIKIGLNNVVLKGF